MNAILVAALLLAPAPGHATPPCLAGGTQVAADDTLRELWEGGRTFADFLDAASRRRDLWMANWSRSDGALDPALVARARATGGPWRLLVVAVDGCSDSVSTIPWVARLVERVEALELRIVGTDVGRQVMEAHPTPDGRAATPTVVLLDEAWVEAGCFIERPRVLQDRLLAGDWGDDPEARFQGKMRWYEEDAGQATVEQVVEMLEAAAEGRVACF